MTLDAETRNAPTSNVEDKDPKSRSSTLELQVKARKKPLEFLDLPTELIQQIVSEVVTEGALALSSDSLKPFKHSVLSLLQTNKRLNKEASERIKRIAVQETLCLYISAADENVSCPKKLQTKEIIAFWERKLQLVPWTIFRKIKIFLMPGLRYHGFRSHHLEKMFEITSVVAPKLQALLSERVQTGDCLIELVYCEMDGNHTSHHYDATLGDIPLPCWTFVDLGYSLEIWAWLRRTSVEQPSPVIHLPNVALVARTSEQTPLKVQYFSRWLGRIWNAEISPAVTGRAISREDFMEKNSREVRIVDATPDDLCFLLSSAKIEGTRGEDPTLIYADAEEIAFHMSPLFEEAGKTLRHIGFLMKAAPSPPIDLQAKYTRLAEDLHTKAHGPGRAGLQEITRRLQDCLQEAKRLQRSDEDDSSAVGSGQDSQLSSREADDIA
jgi:hypothetical protein